MNNFTPLYCLFPVLLTVISATCQSDHGSTKQILGIYGSPQPLWDKGYKLNELGVNAIFVHSGSISHDMISRSRSEGAQVFAEFATLNGKNYVEEHPEAWAINEKGEKVEAASWFMGVCPTEPGFRKYRQDQLQNLLTEYDLDGVWLDYLHWHAQFEEPEPILPETCFCDHCLNAFAAKSGITIVDGTTAEKAAWIINNHDPIWRDWRCEVLYDWTVEMKSITKSIKPSALFGLYHCPWDDQEFNGARRYNLGLDYDLLKESIEIFSPMVYHERMGRQAGWVQENLSWFLDRLDIQSGSYPQVWPIVQAYNNPGPVSADEFETVLRAGLEGEANGVMMFTTRAIADDPEKIEVMRKVYTEN